MWSGPTSLLQRADERGPLGAGRHHLPPRPPVALEAQPDVVVVGPGHQELGDTRIGTGGRAGHLAASTTRLWTERPMRPSSSHSSDSAAPMPGAPKRVTGVETHPLPPRWAVDRDGEIGIDEQVGAERGARRSPRSRSRPPPPPAATGWAAHPGPPGTGAGSTPWPARARSKAPSTYRISTPALWKACCSPERAGRGLPSAGGAGACSSGTVGRTSGPFRAARIRRARDQATSRPAGFHHGVDELDPPARSDDGAGDPQRCLRDRSEQLEGDTDQLEVVTAVDGLGRTRRQSGHRTPVECVGRPGSDGVPGGEERSPSGTNRARVRRCSQMRLVTPPTLVVRPPTDRAYHRGDAAHAGAHATGRWPTEQWGEPWDQPGSIDIRASAHARAEGHLGDFGGIGGCMPALSPLSRATTASSRDDGHDHHRAGGQGRWWPGPSPTPSPEGARVEAHAPPSRWPPRRGSHVTYDVEARPDEMSDRRPPLPAGPRRPEAPRRGDDRVSRPAVGMPEGSVVQRGRRPGGRPRWRRSGCFAVAARWKEWSFLIGRTRYGPVLLMPDGCGRVAALHPVRRRLTEEAVVFDPPHHLATSRRRASRCATTGRRHLAGRHRHPGQVVVDVRRADPGTGRLMRVVVGGMLAGSPSVGGRFVDRHHRSAPEAVVGGRGARCAAARGRAAGAAAGGTLKPAGRQPAGPGPPPDAGPRPRRRSGSAPASTTGVPATHTSETSRLDADHTRCSTNWAGSISGVNAGSSTSTSTTSASHPGASDAEVGAVHGGAGPAGGEVERGRRRVGPRRRPARSGRTWRRPASPPTDRGRCSTPGRRCPGRPGRPWSSRSTRRRHPRRQLGVALRAVGHGHPVLGVDADVVVVEPDAVGGQHPASEDPGGGQPGMGEHPALGGNRRPRPRSRPRGSAAGRPGTGPARRRCAAPPPARCRARGAQRRPRCGRPRRAGDGGRRDRVEARLEGGRRQRTCLEHRRSGQAPRAGIDDRVDEGVLVEVQLARGRHPDPQQLGGGERHAPVDVGGGQPGLPRPQHLAEPPVDREPRSDAPQQRHGRVAVHVDESRQEDPGQALIAGTGRRGRRRHGRPCPPRSRRRPASTGPPVQALHRRMAGTAGGPGRVRRRQNDRVRPRSRRRPE